jgi:Protein of unknown function (DUF742)
MTGAAGRNPDEQWIDDSAGPVVRPYAMTRGRTRPTAGQFDLITLVLATRAPVHADIGLGPEHLAIFQLCQRPQSVAEVAAHLKLPLGTVRVMLGDLLERNLIEVREPRLAASPPDDSIFEAVIDGLRAL